MTAALLVSATAVAIACYAVRQFHYSFANERAVVNILPVAAPLSTSSSLPLTRGQVSIEPCRSLWTGLCLALLLLLGVGAAKSYAAIDVREFGSELERQRYQSFIDDMRCPKCQNQSLSGSDSPIALDLRNELYLQIQEGRSDKEIVDFMVDRYGDFILYKPRLTSATLLLWGLPVLLVVLGIILLIWIVRRRRLLQVESGLSGDEQARLAALLGSRQPTGAAAAGDNPALTTGESAKK